MLVATWLMRRYGREFAPAESITHLRASWSPYRHYLHLHLSAAAKGSTSSFWKLCGS